MDIIFIIMKINPTTSGVFMLKHIDIFLPIRIDKHT